MMWVLPVIGCILLVSYFLPKMPRVGGRRLIGWLMILGFVFLVSELIWDAYAVIRMVLICITLLMGMKGLVYVEWCEEREQCLSWKGYLVFVFLWFGMDPSAFVKRRSGLKYANDFKIGLACMAVGALGMWLIWKMDWRNVIVMFLPMSLGFHFGALRVLKGLHRWYGYPVRTLFRNPLMSQGAADFWSRRWNLGYSQMMMRVVGRPLGVVFGEKIGLISVFVISGLLHEFAITLPVKSGYGLPTLFFLGHGVLVSSERFVPVFLRRVVFASLLLASMSILFPEVFQREVFDPCFDQFVEIIK